MGEVLFELEQVLRMKRERLTSGEANIFFTSKSKALREFTVGTLVGSGVTWLATWKLNRYFQVGLSGGAAVVLGLWKFGRSLDSSVDQILAIDGSRLQKELANIMANKYHDDPWSVKLMAKHFYSEKVYDDSTLDQPKLRWRYKNYFSDNVANGQRTRESNSHGDSHSDSLNNSHNDSHSEDQSSLKNDPGSKKNELRPKQVPVTLKPNVDAMGDPLDCVFGSIATAEEICHPKTSGMPNRAHTRSHRRSHRWRRMHHHDISADTVHT